MPVPITLSSNTCIFRVTLIQQVGWKAFRGIMQLIHIISWAGYAALLLLVIGFTFASGYSCPSRKTSFIPGFVVGFIFGGFYLTSFLIALPFSLVSFSGYAAKQHSILK